MNRQTTINFACHQHRIGNSGADSCKLNINNSIGHLCKWWADVFQIPHHRQYVNRYALFNMEFAGVFIKFGAQSHLLKLQKEGLLYCNTIEYFSKLEDGNLRGDDHENIVEFDYIEKGILNVFPKEDQKTKSLTLKFKSFKLKTSRVDPFGNLFCLHAINVLDKIINEPFQIDPKNKKFGDYFLLITDTSEFLNRLEKSLNQQDQRFTYGMVEYLDFSKFKGKKTIFQKKLSYSYQAEFRILMHTTLTEPLEIMIGDISDISLLYSSDLLETFQMKYNFINA